MIPRWLVLLVVVAAAAGGVLLVVGVRTADEPITEEGKPPRPAGPARPSEPSSAVHPSPAATDGEIHGREFGTSVVPVPPPPPADELPAAPPAGSPGEYERFLGDLSSAEAGKRFSAAVELGKLRDERAIEPLKQVLLADRDTFVRRAAARALGEVGSLGAVPALIEVLEDDEYFVVTTAQKALETLTGEKLEGVEKWRKWWQGR